MRGTPLALLLLAFVALLPPAQAANFGGHVGLAHAIWEDPYFRAGALIPDLDHFLPPGEPRTDDATFALGLAKRAWNGSRNAWRFATGWYEHVDQDLQFADSVDRIVKAHPSYSETDVRLAFDYWTLRKHPFPTDFDWILSDEEVLGLIQGGLVGTDLAGVRSAVNQLLHSTNLSNPGLALQIQAANTYGAFYGEDRKSVV